jgi:hypothetical protein
MKSDQRAAFGSASCESRAAARARRRGENGSEWRVETLPQKGAAHDLFFPTAHQRIGRVLQQATAATARMRAGWAYPVRRGREDADAHKPVALKLAFDHLARQRASHEDRSVRALPDAVTTMAETVDRQDHSAASRSSVPMKPPDWRFQ